MHKRHLIAFLFCLTFGSSSFGQTQYEAYPLGFYNLENLFDTVDNEDVRDTEFTPEGDKAWTDEKYQKKLKNMASVIRNLGTDMSPTGVIGLGVSEIENVGVLEDLAKEPALADKSLKIVHYDSPDKRGIDNAFLYNPAFFNVVDSKPFTLLIKRDGERKFTRDVLYVKGTISEETVHILVNHWPSRSGGEKRSAPLRAAAAELNKRIVDSLYSIDSGAKIILMGDLNDDPTSPSIKKVLKAKKKISQTKAGELYNPMYVKYQRGEGSNAYRDAWSLFDQIIVSQPLLDKTQEGLFFHRAEIYKEPRMIQASGQYKYYPLRTFGNGVFKNGYSDHFPVVAYLLKKV